MEYKLATVESKFSDLVWEHEPLTSSELVSLCAVELNWKRTTTYTVLKKLCERGIFRLCEGVVSAQISKEEFYAKQCTSYVDTTFQGSLPLFVAAFARERGLSEKDKKSIIQMIENM